jgi:hypothetical protein
MPFDGCPPDAKFPGDDSPVVWGQCGHAFHLQCITKWLNSQQVGAGRYCPLHHPMHVKPLRHILVATSSNAFCTLVL